MSTPTESSQSNARVTWAIIALATVCLLWAGMIFENGFEAGVKFTTPGLQRAVGMAVGQTVFNAFSKVEMFWCAVTFGLLVLVRPFYRMPRLVGVLLVLVWLIVAFQTIVLLPILAERAQIVMQGGEPPASPAHRLFTSSALIKLIALITTGVATIRQLR